MQLGEQHYYCYYNICVGTTLTLRDGPSITEIPHATAIL